MKKSSAILIILFIPLLAIGQQTGEELVAASIKFHDPGNNWAKTKAIYNFSDTRPGKEARPATLFLNNTNNTLCIMREQDGVKVTRHTENDICSYDIDGNFQPSAEEIEEYSLNKERSLMLRNYYLYLWGLPMKLTDPGTMIDLKIYHKKFNNKPARAARVTYDAEVGSDIWYFYFDPGTNEMIGYQFFHDEAKGDGEYILLSELMEINGMKIPKNRAWYTNPDSTLLGTDHLLNTAALVHSH
jgi:hypothetical protein